MLSLTILVGCPYNKPGKNYHLGYCEPFLVPFCIILFSLISGINLESIERSFVQSLEELKIVLKKVFCDFAKSNTRAKDLPGGTPLEG